MFTRSSRFCLGLLVVCGAVAAPLPKPQAAEIGFGVVDITPDVQADSPVWLAGYGQNRKATGVHDPLFARAVVVRDAGRKIAIVVADVVGIFYPTTLEIRKRLEGFDYVLVAATHNHEGPDTMGLWGSSPVRSGVDPKYMEILIERCVEAVQQADSHARAFKASYGTAENAMLLRDSRLPIVRDGVLRAIRCIGSDGMNLGLLIQWNCHPEAMGPRNTQITADFLQAMIAKLEKTYQCPVVVVSGALGGLMAPPRDVIRDQAGQLLEEGDFEYCRLYGDAVADLAVQAVENSGPISLTPIRVASQEIALPMWNPVYQLGATLGLIRRQAYLWTGDYSRLGEAVDIVRARGKAAIASEVAYLKLGQLHIVGIPGELYPELVYGQFQQPVEPNVDFPDAPLEKAVVESIQSDKFLLIGLANDEVGYIIPKRQWDDQAPYAYGRETKQYGEVNSIGPETAPIIMRAFEECVQQAASP